MSSSNLYPAACRKVFLVDRVLKGRNSFYANAPIYLLVPVVSSDGHQVALSLKYGLTLNARVFVDNQIDYVGETLLVTVSHWFKKTFFPELITNNPSQEGSSAIAVDSTDEGGDLIFIAQLDTSGHDEEYEAEPAKDLRGSQIAFGAGVRLVRSLETC